LTRDSECEQFVDRMLLLLMPIKYQPDYIYLRHVQTSRVHYFTVVQITCSALMWAVKSVKATSIAFPLMVLTLSLVSPNFLIILRVSVYYKYTTLHRTYAY